MLVKAKYQGDFPQPSKLVKHETKPKGPQTAEEIKQYIIDKLGKLADNGATMRRVNGDEITNGSYDLGSARDA